MNGLLYNTKSTGTNTVFYTLKIVKRCLIHVLLKIKYYMSKREPDN